MDEDLVSKQQFLYSEIIDGGYNPDQFQQYLCKAHPEWGTQLSYWPMNQLKKITQEFKQAYGQTKNEEQVQKQSESTQKIEEETQSPLKSGTIVYGQKHQNYSKIVDCIKFPQTKFLNNQAKCFIQKFQKRQGSVFEKSYYIFFIGIKNGPQKVQRRYSDFEWMRDTLIILHPGIPVPPISKKGGMKKRSDEKHLMKRMYLLQKFLNKLMRIAELRTDEIFQKFMTISSQKQFEKYKAKYKKIKTPQIQKIQTISGNLQLILGQQTNTFISRTQKYISITQPEVKKIYKDFKGAASMLENCSTFLKSIGTNCHKLSTNYRQFRKQANMSLTQQNLFSLLNQMTSKYAELLNQQAKTFRKQIYALVKYQSFYMLNMLQSLEKLAQIQQNFIEEKTALKKRKQKLFDEGNMAKWGLTEKLNDRPQREQAFQIMLPKQTKQLLKDRDKYALYNSMIYNQALRYFKENDLYLYDHFEEIVKMETDISTRSIMVWADVLTKTKGLTVNVP